MPSALKDPDLAQPGRGLRFGVVILAAGASRRMGRPKLILPWGPTSILGHLLSVWQQLGARQITAVCAKGDQVVWNELDRLGYPVQGRILNSTPEQGMISSIRAAAQWSGRDPTLTHWAIVLGDQPQLGSRTLGKLLSFAEASPSRICQPSYRQRPRHPVLLPQVLFNQLSTSTAPDLRAFLQGLAQPAALCEIDDPTLDIDLDTPADYNLARRTRGETP